MPISTVLDNFIDVVIKVAGVSSLREPACNFEGQISLVDDPANDALNLTVDPTTPWVLITDADSPYLANPDQPWIAVDFRAADVEIRLWFGAEGDELHIVDAYGAQGSGPQVTVRTSATRDADGRRQVIADGGYSGGFNYSASAIIFDTGGGAPPGIAYFRFRTDDSLNIGNGWVHADGANAAGPISNAASIACAYPNFGMALTCSIANTANISFAVPTFSISIAATVVISGSTIACALPNWTIAAACTITNPTSISFAYPNFAISAAAAAIRIVGSSTVNTADAQTFTVTGLTGSPTWSLSANNSGGSIGSSSGDYVAGDTGGGGQLSAIIDTIHVTDGTYSANFNVTVAAALPGELSPTVVTDATTLSLSDGDAVSTWGVGGSAGGSWTVQGGSPTYKTNIIAGRPVVRYNGTTDFHQSLSNTMAAFAAPAHLTLFFLGTVTPVLADLGTPETNNGVIGENGGYFALTSTTTAGHLFVAEDFPNVLPSGSQTLITSPVIAAYRKDGTTLGLQVTSFGSEVTTTDSATFTSQTGNAQLGRGYATKGACDITYIVAYNVAMSSSQRARTFNFLKSLGGASL